jgi:glycosyltransferase involved in cell wall biosynthesis
MSYDLAIIIPAFKPDFLKEALDSLLSQTDRRFSLYVFDDASPHNLQEIVDFADSDNVIHYHRFEENMGRHSLAKHWNRCIRMAGAEPWVWLFSDDDLADPNCVEAFYQTKSDHPGHNAYRFNTCKISADGEIIKENTFPETFDAADFLNLKLSYTEESYVVETVFSRDIFEQAGGIPELPLAWASDDLFTVNLSLNGNIRTISGARVQWRFSDKNISGKSSGRSAVRKLEASREFVRRILSEQKLSVKLDPPDLPVRWYVRQIRTLLDQLNLSDQLLGVYKMSKTDRRVWKHYLAMKKEKSRSYQWLKRSLS